MTARPAAMLDRRDLLPALFADPRGWLFVSGLAGASRDAAALTSDGPNLFSMAGAMGAALPLGLGMALAAPDRQVAVITGDGEMLMGAGALATVASAAPGNLTIICQDNAMHGETGGQPGHTARGTDIEAMARGAGLTGTLTISAPDELGQARDFLARTPGPRLLVARVRAGPPSDFRRDMDLAACRVRFRDHYRSP